MSTAERSRDRDAGDEHLQNGSSPFVPVPPNANPENFELALYRWSLQEAMNDFSSGFSLLKSIKNSEARVYVRYVNQLAPAVQPMFVAALAGYDRLKDLRLCDDDVKPALLEYLKKKALRSARTRSIRADSLTPCRDIYEQLHILGKCERRGKNWEFRTPSAGYRIVTVVRANSFLEYCHHVYAPCGTCVLQHVSFLRWYGIAERTVWEGVRGTPDRSSLKLFKHVCIHFIASFPDILAEVARK